MFLGESAKVKAEKLEAVVPQGKTLDLVTHYSFRMSAQSDSSGSSLFIIVNL